MGVLNEELLNEIGVSSSMFLSANIFSSIFDDFGTCYVTGISLKTQELYAVVFITRYLDLFLRFISL